MPALKPLRIPSQKYTSPEAVEPSTPRMSRQNIKRSMPGVSRHHPHLHILDAVKQYTELSPEQVEKAEYYHRLWKLIKDYEQQCGRLRPEMSWSERFDTQDTPEVEEFKKSQPVYIFRQTLSSFLAQSVCTSPVQCVSFGSTKASSDIDVTIDGGIAHIREALFTYIKIRSFLNIVFHGDDVFIDQPHDVFHFFDLNYYLSNFALKYHPSLPDNRLSSYILSTAYGKSFGKDATKVRNQMFYTTNDILTQDKPANKSQYARDEMYAKNVMNVASRVMGVEPNDDKQNIKNEIIDLLSQISTYEDECYHTQGSFFHVVLMMQRKIEFVDIHQHLDVFVNMLYTSALENMAFAYTHRDQYKKMMKYVNRVNDALYRIRAVIPAQTKMIIEPLPTPPQKDNTKKLQTYGNVIFKTLKSSIYTLLHA